jgi:hypothetical protein
MKKYILTLQVNIDSQLTFCHNIVNFGLRIDSGTNSKVSITAGAKAKKALISDAQLANSQLPTGYSYDDFLCATPFSSIR